MEPLEPVIVIIAKSLVPSIPSPYIVEFQQPGALLVQVETVLLTPPTICWPILTPNWPLPIPSHYTDLADALPFGGGVLVLPMVIGTPLHHSYAT